MKDQTKAQVIKLMRNLINKDIENKEAGFIVEQARHNSPIGAGDCYPLIQAIPEGTDGESRLGDKIKPKSLVVRGTIALDPAFQPDTKPFYVRVLMLTQKDIKVSTSVTAGNVDTAHLLRPAYPGAPETAFIGSRDGLNMPVNDNKFRVLMDRTYLFCPTAAASGFPLTNAQVHFKKAIKKLPATLTYDQGNGNYANNFAPFIAIGYAYPDGSPPDLVDTRITTSIHSKLSFEDA